MTTLLNTKYNKTKSNIINRRFSKISMLISKYDTEQAKKILRLMLFQDFPYLIRFLIETKKIIINKFSEDEKSKAENLWLKLLNAVKNKDWENSI